MNSIWVYSLLSVFIVSLISFVGLFTFSIRAERMKQILIYFISLAAGALFGDVFIHLLPDIARDTGFTLTVSLSLLGGVLLFFALEKAIHAQHYHHGNIEEHAEKHAEKKEIKPIAYMSLTISTIHNFIDGLVIAAAYFINIPAGIGTTFAVALHEIPHEFGSFSILVHGGFSRRRALFVNFLSAFAAVIGALVALLLSGTITHIENVLIPVAAGGLLYIAGSDLIPELHKESSGFRAALLQILAFVLGIALMLALLLVG